MLSVVLIALGILGVTFPEDDGDLYFGIFMISFGVLFTPMTLLITILLQKSENKSSTVLSSETEEVLFFDADKITITQQKGDEFTSVTTAKYSYLYKVIENKQYYFLYISKMQSHVVDKTSLVQGTLDELNFYLMSNLGARFRRS